MNRVEAACFHGANALVALTGLGYAWTAYFARSEDPFALVNHPLQPWFQHAHVLVAPLLVFAGGAMVHGHATAKLRHSERTRRMSGWSLLALLAPMVFSGYLLQTATDESWRRVSLWVHWITAALWIIGSVAHLVARRAASPRSDYASVGSVEATTSGETRG